MKTLVVGTDGSEGAERAMEEVIELVREHGATVHLVCVYPAQKPLERLGLTARQELVVRHGGRNAQSNNTSKNGCDAIPCIVHDLCLQWSAWNCGSCGQSGYALIN